MIEPPAPARPPRPAFRRRIRGARNLAASYVGAAADGFVFLLLTPFLVRRLGLAGFGLWGLAVSLADWFQLFDLGLREALLKYLSAHQARADLRGARRTVEAVGFVYVILGAAAFAIVVVADRAILPWLVDDPLELETLRSVFFILGASGAISLPAGALGYLLEGLSRFDLLNLIRIGHQMLRLTLVVLALQFELGLIGVALAELLSRIALHATRFMAVRRLHPELLPFPKPHLDELRRLFGVGLWNGARQVADVVSLRLYEPILALFAGLPSIGAFYAGRKFAAIPAEAIVPMAGVLLPLSSEMEAEGRGADLGRTLVTTSKLALAVSAPIALLIGIGAPMIQANWLGGRAPEAEAVMMIFSAVFVAVATFMPAESILLGLGRFRLVALCAVAQVALTILLGIPLTARMDAPGLAFAALTATLVAQFAVLIPAGAVACGVPAYEWIRRALLPVAAAAVPVGIVMITLRDRVAVGGLAGIAAWGGGGMLTYGALFWAFGLTAEEKLYIREHSERIFLESSKDEEPSAR